MGWVGVAALIATACFLLYRYPPQSWTSDFSPPPQSESTSDRSPTTPVTGDVNMKNISKSLENEDENSDECQTTPKASTSNAPALDVPTLSLNDDNADKATGAEKRSGQEERTQNGSMKPPVNEPTTLMPPPPRQPQASSSSLMPPPPPPRLRNPQSQPQSSSSSLSPGLYPPRLNAGGSLRPPPSAAAAARAPPSSRLTSSNSLAPIQVTMKPSSARKAVLEPGYSPLDWAALTSNPNNKLRGANLPPSLIRVTPAMLQAQNGRKGRDAWTSYQGKVYNITPYLPFHPGGKGELLRGAGKDSGKLFMEIHPWVNWDAMLGECLVGILVSENEVIGESSLDAMD